LKAGKPQTGFAGIGAYTAIFTVVYAPIACANLTNLLLAHANKTFSFVTLALEIGVRRIVAKQVHAGRDRLGEDQEPCL
jgi:hypothetical protein